MHKFILSLSVWALSGITPLLASELAVSIELPRLQVAEYHRPYVAAWVEDGNRGVAANLLVWYQQDRPGAAARAESGTKWLPDLRQWWRRAGRGLEMPLDGVSSATRPVGTHALQFTAGEPPLNDLAAGEYRLRVEAAREEGGRELLDIPFTWPPSRSSEQTVRGQSELGTVSLTLTP